ncbi:hypothetical protein, partial [Mycobacteroides abscessus]|uniref:hypothetical protein n=1 Tax=Mycobacteroides abscessus TaxID=36809 RepID=UPI001A9C3426
NPVSSKIIIREGASSRDPQVLIIAQTRSPTAISQQGRKGYEYRMPFVDVNGQRIHYTDSGEGPVIVATHATLMDTVSLEPLTSRLPGRVV